MAKICVCWKLEQPDDGLSTDVMAKAELHGDGLYLNVYELEFGPDNQFLGGVRIHWLEGQLIADIDTEANLHHETKGTRLVLYDPVHRPWHDDEGEGGRGCRVRG